MFGSKAAEPTHPFVRARQFARHRSGHQGPSRPRTTFCRGPRIRTSCAGQGSRAVDPQDRAHPAPQDVNGRSRIADSDRVSTERPVGHPTHRHAKRSPAGCTKVPCPPCRRTGDFLHRGGRSLRRVSSGRRRRADDGPEQPRRARRRDGTPISELMEKREPNIRSSGG